MTLPRKTKCMNIAFHFSSKSKDESLIFHDYLSLHSCRKMNHADPTATRLQNGQFPFFGECVWYSGRGEVTVKTHFAISP